MNQFTAEKLHLSTLITMKRLFVLILLSLPLSLAAQNYDQALITDADSLKSIIDRLLPDNNKHLSANMNLEFSTSATANLTKGSLSQAEFKVNRVRMEIKGSFAENFEYHFRQSFNKYSNPHAVDNLSSSVEYANVSWTTSKWFKLTMGKQNLALGGHEYVTSGLKVREFTEFNNNIQQFQTGIGGEFTLSPDHSMKIQLLNSRAGSDANTYIYGLPIGQNAAKAPLTTILNWNGYFADRVLNLRYGIGSGELAQKAGILYLTAGHVYEKGPVLAYVDFMYSREGIDSKGLLSEMTATWDTPQTLKHTEYMTAIADIDFRFHKKWNVYIKGAYETGRIYKANCGLEPGLYRVSWNAQTSMEYYPLNNSELKLYLHILYKGYHLTKLSRQFSPDFLLKNTQRISIGFVYKIPVF